MASLNEYTKDERVARAMLASERIAYYCETLTWLKVPVSRAHVEESMAAQVRYLRVLVGLE